MNPPTLVQIWACSRGSQRKATRIVQLDVLLRYMVGRLSVLEIEQVRNDLTVTGRARAAGKPGRWFEYEIVDTGAA